MANRILIVMLVGAALITSLLGNAGVNLVKVSGSGLAVLTFLPVFLILKYQIASTSPTRIILVFVWGFGFKLMALLIMTWIAISVLNWDTVDFVVASMVFLVTLQIYESAYFLELQKNSDREHSRL